jgi:hypothetical protein
MGKKTQEEHESFGMLGFSRTSNSPGLNLFGSSVKHRNTVVMTVKRATKLRDLNYDHYFGGETLIEIELSPMQFAEAITTLNVGDGIPCTIRRINNHGVEDCPEETVRQRFEDEFADTCKESTKAAYDLVEEARNLLDQKTIRKSDCKNLIEVLQRLATNLSSNLPFVQSQFNESMDKVTTDAKTSVEAFFLHRINEIGVKSLQEGKSLLENNAPVIQIESH